MSRSLFWLKDSRTLRYGEVVGGAEGRGAKRSLGASLLSEISSGSFPPLARSPTEEVGCGSQPSSKVKNGQGWRACSRRPRVREGGWRARHPVLNNSA